MSKKTSKKPKSKNIIEMQLVNPNAAGQDFGALSQNPCAGLQPLYIKNAEINGINEY